MWTEELDNGKFKFKERYFDEYTGKNRYVSVTMEQLKIRDNNILKGIRVL